MSAIRLNPFKGQEEEMSGAESGTRFVAPQLLDLMAFPQEPGHEHRETLLAMAQSARLGGVGLVGLMPSVSPPADHDGVIRTLRHGARTEKTGVGFVPHGALSLALKHEDIAPMGELKAAGVRMVSDGGKPVRDTRFLRRVLEYAKNFDLPVHLTPVDPDLAEGALAPEGPESTRLGLPCVPDVGERLAVLRAGEFARLTGAHVVLYPIVTAAGLDALKQLQNDGVSISGGTALPYLVWSVNDLSDYDSLYRLTPPLSRADDVLALAAGVKDGSLSFLATGHRAVNLSEKETELAVAEPGMAVLPHTWSFLQWLHKNRDIPMMSLVAAMTSGPAKILGIEPWDSEATLSEGEVDYGEELARNIPNLPNATSLVADTDHPPQPITI
jgi:dihydroorotase